MARSKKSFRNVDGILPLDKPPGVTSNQALQSVKRLYRARKAGHTGTLDPIASGLLLICFGQATKVSSYLLNADKLYYTTCKLGVKTTTGDTEGEVIERRTVPDYSTRKIDTVLGRFLGEIEQIPPMHSALKHNGKRLYQLARDGVEVEREPRLVRIYELRFVERTAESLTLIIECSKGTYIRTLVEDIGEALGCGAHVSALRRIGVGPYSEETAMVSMDALSVRAKQGFAALDEMLKPIDSALMDWPAVTLTEDMAFYARCGQPVLAPGAPLSGSVRLYEDSGGFIGVGELLDDGRVAPRRLMMPYG